MSALATLTTSERPQTEHSVPAPRMFSMPAGSTLEDKILGAWEDLGAHGQADCPVCGDSLSRQGCGSCGSELK